MKSTVGSKKISWVTWSLLCVHSVSHTGHWSLQKNSTDQEFCWSQGKSIMILKIVILISISDLDFVAASIFANTVSFSPSIVCMSCVVLKIPIGDNCCELTISSLIQTLIFPWTISRSMLHFSLDNETRVMKSARKRTL